MKITVSDSCILKLVELLEITRDTQFLIGDMLIEIVRNNGVENKQEVIAHLAGKLQVAQSTLYDYYRVSSKWTPLDRITYQSLEWTIYRNTNPSSPEDKEILNKVVDRGLSVTEFKALKYKHESDTTFLVKRVIGMIKKILKTLETADDNDVLVSVLEALESYTGIEKND